MDAYLEDSYQAWKTRQRMKGGIAKKKRRRLGDDGELRWGPASQRALGPGACLQRQAGAAVHASWRAAR